jgi:hypothetical protein
MSDFLLGILHMSLIALGIVLGFFIGANYQRHKDRMPKESSCACKEPGKPRRKTEIRQIPEPEPVYAIPKRAPNWWSEGDIDTVRQHLDLSPREIHERYLPNRTEGAIRNKRDKLRQERSP